MVGGDAGALETVKAGARGDGIAPEKIVHVGESGAGQICKACNQIVLGGTMAVVAEAIALSRKAGVDPMKVRAALMGGFAQSRVLEVHGERMINANYKPGFKAKLFKKDLGIAMNTLAENGVSAPASASCSSWCTPRWPKAVAKKTTRPSPRSFSTWRICEPSVNRRGPHLGVPMVRRVRKRHCLRRLVCAARWTARVPHGQEPPFDRSPLAIARVLAAKYPAQPIMSYIPALSWSGSFRLAALTQRTAMEGQAAPRHAAVHRRHDAGDR